MTYWQGSPDKIIRDYLDGKAEHWFECEHGSSPSTDCPNDECEARELYVAWKAVRPSLLATPA